MLLVPGLFGVLAAIEHFGPGSREPRQALHLPSAGTLDDAARGRELFLANCACCHGQDLKGMDREPPLIHPVYRSGHHSDLAFHLAVKNGVRQYHWHFGDVPCMTGASPEQAGEIIAFVRQEQRDAGIR